ncbi:hypothetical protein EV211_12822 [Aminicella lysinilytica]|uniref:Uncharacterized protein n=1 Tax=Aminicella lysinilytica TaxID=433323 RepID=A0A4R6PZ80_9FIRM|nr:hypothetical protein EV211_12822 [Aminicella lysinilytica]
MMMICKSGNLLDRFKVNDFRRKCIPIVVVAQTAVCVFFLRHAVVYVIRAIDACFQWKGGIFYSC